MVNAKKIKKRYYIFVVFYVFLFGPIIIYLLDEVVSSDFTQKYKTIISVFKYFCSKSGLTALSKINNSAIPNKK